MLLSDGSRLDASGFGSDYDEAFFERDGLAALRKWFDGGGLSGPRVDSSVRLGPPICRPSKIICIGANFHQHAIEAGLGIPKEPVVFFKSTTSLAGPNDDVIIPRGAEKVDWEVELAVVIGKKASYIAKDRAFEYISGFVLHNDYSERSFQLERGGQWVKGKSADTFAPLGPFLATRDEIAEPGHLNMWLKVNGGVRQSGSTSDMIFDVPTLVSYLSDFMTPVAGGCDQHGNACGRGAGDAAAEIFEGGRYCGVGDRRTRRIASEAGGLERVVPAARGILQKSDCGIFQFAPPSEIPTIARTRIPIPAQQ